MSAVKTVRQDYVASDQIGALMEMFRRMVNDCIRIGLRANATSLKSLSLKAYPRLEYDCMSYYKLCAISRAVGILKNYRKAKRRGRPVKEPYVMRPLLTTCYRFKIEGGNLLLPFKPRAPIAIPLNRHVIDRISQLGITIRSVTLTQGAVALAYSKSPIDMKAKGLISIDVNLDNATLADSKGECKRYDLSRVNQIKATYRYVRSRFTRDDARITRRISSKYGRKERNKVLWILHNASKAIVEEAKRKRFGIVMEDLTGIQRLYRRGNGRGRNYRGRMNSWSFRELQHQIDYKARWEGLPVVYVRSHGTSAKCSVCGSNMSPEEGRMLRCASCGYLVDRDVNAARNVLARGVRFAPLGLPVEAMRGNAQTTAPILGVDGSQVA